MPRQTWYQTLAYQQAPGTLFNNYTTAKSVINPQAVTTLPAGFLEYPGVTLELHVSGGISNIVTTPGTMVFQFMLGSVIAWTSGNIQLNATAHTTLPFTLDVELTTQTVGSSTTAKLSGMGRLGGVMFTLTAGQTDATNTSGLYMVPATAPAQGTGFDSTAAQVVDFWVGFSIANSGNGVQINNYRLVSVN